MLFFALSGFTRLARGGNLVKPYAVPVPNQSRLPPKGKSLIRVPFETTYPHTTDMLVVDRNTTATPPSVAFEVVRTIVIRGTPRTVPTQCIQFKAYPARTLIFQPDPTVEEATLNPATLTAWLDTNRLPNLENVTILYPRLDDCHWQILEGQLTKPGVVLCLPQDLPIPENWRALWTRV